MCIETENKNQTESISINLVEDNTANGLTEDMIDAAMTEESYFQDSVDSEEEFNSSDNNIDVEQDVRATMSNTTSSSYPNNGQIQNSADSINKIIFGGPSQRVVVIETGLDKVSEIKIENTSLPSTSASSSTHIPYQTEGTTIINCQGNSNTNSSSTRYKTNSDSQNCSTTEEYKVPILQSILKGSANKVPINLCHSDTDENTDGDVIGEEMLDNELQSVMESNFLAEFGLAKNTNISKLQNPKLTKSKDFLSSPATNKPCFRSVEKLTKPPMTMTSPKLQMNNVTQISPSMFNNMSLSNKQSEAPIVNNRSEVKADESVILKSFQIPNFIVKPKDHTIQLNKIAIPHQTVFSSQGQKMNCVYIANTSGTPVVINSSQLPSTSKNNVAHMKTQQVQKTASELHSHVEKRQSPFNQLTVPTKQPVLPINQSSLPTNQSSFQNNHHQVVTNYQPNKLNYQSVNSKPNSQLGAPAIVKTALQRIPTPTINQQDKEVAALIKSLLVQSLSKPYVPPEMTRHVTLFECSDCHDRFVVQSSLIHHLARRSFIIRYWCTTCTLELHFFNRCVFLGHLRSHNFPMSQLDYSKVEVSPLSKETIQNGVVSTFFKECVKNFSLPYEDCILSNSRRELAETANQRNSSNNKYLTTYSTNVSPKQTTALAVSQPTNPPQPRVSLLLGKTTTPRLTCTSSTKEVSLMPVHLPKSTALPSVKNVRKYSTEQSTDNTKILQKNFFLVLDKQNKPSNVKLNVLPPNELFSVTDNMVIHEGSLEMFKERGKGEVNKESMTVASRPGTTASSAFNTSKGKSTSISSVKQIRRPSLPAKPFSEKPLKRVCSECGVSCLSIEKHLNGCSRPINPLLTCERCGLILPTKCALKCHLRMHERMPPYKCPDCGKNFPACSDLYSHLKMSCGHFAKRARYYCHTCKLHFVSKSILADHFTTVHSLNVFRCSGCLVAFYNKSSFNSHMFTTIHRDETVVSLHQKQCNLCPSTAIPLNEFDSHLQNHINNSSALIYIYECPLCNLTFVNKIAFIIHQVDEMKQMDNNSTKAIDKNKLAKVNYQDTVHNEHKSNPKQNSNDFEFVEQYPNLEDNVTAAEKDPLSSDGLEFLNDQRFKEKREEVCIVCKTNAIVLLPGVNVDQQSLCCKQCVKTVDVQSTVQNVQTKMKTSFTKDQKIISNSNPNLKKNAQTLIKHSPNAGKRSYSGENTQNRAKKQKKSSFSPNRVGLNTESRSNLVKNKNGKYRKIDFGGESSHFQGKIIAFQSPDELVCAKCKYFAKTKETFLEHIKVHRMDPNTYQCLECGLCFVVMPSLERHLQMNHGIRDVNKYMVENKSCLPKKICFEETQCLKENQCRVCLEIYDSSSSLEKHFRTHGMAFMSSLSKSP